MSRLSRIIYMEHGISDDPIQSPKPPRPLSLSTVCLVTALPFEVVEKICRPLLFQFPNRPYTSDLKSISRLSQTCTRLRDVVTPILYHWALADFSQLGYPASTWPVARDANSRLLKIFRTLVERPDFAAHVKVASIRALQSGLCAGLLKLGEADLEEAYKILSQGPWYSNLPSSYNNSFLKSSAIMQALTSRLPNLADFSMELDADEPDFRIWRYLPHWSLPNLRKLQVSFAADSRNLTFDLSGLEVLLCQARNLQSLDLKSTGVIKVSSGEGNLSLRNLSKLSVEGGLHSEDLELLLSNSGLLQTIALHGHLPRRVASAAFAPYLWRHKATLQSLCLMLGRTQDLEMNDSISFKMSHLGSLERLETLAIAGDLIIPWDQEEVPENITCDALPKSIRRLMISKSNKLELFRPIIAVLASSRLCNLEEVIVSTGGGRTYFLCTEPQNGEPVNTLHVETLGVLEKDFPQLVHMSQGSLSHGYWKTIALPKSWSALLRVEQMIARPEWNKVTKLNQALDLLAKRYVASWR